MPVVPSVLSPSHPLTLSPSPTLSGLALSYSRARAVSLPSLPLPPSLHRPAREVDPLMPHLHID